MNVHCLQAICLGIGVTIKAHVGSFSPLNTRENFVLVSHGGYEEGLCTLTFVLTCDSVELNVDIFCYGLLSLILPSSSP